MWFSMTLVSALSASPLTSENVLTETDEALVYLLKASKPFALKKLSQLSCVGYFTDSISLKHTEEMTDGV